MTVDQSQPRSADGRSGVPDVGARRYAVGFWAVAFALLIVMASATLPSPLYGLYRLRDNLSSLTITIVFAIFAGGTIAALVSVPAIVPRIGRRGVMLGSVVTMMIATGLLASWKSLAGLLIGRVITGIGVGLAAGTAFVYLIELRARARPNSSPLWAQTIGSAATVGALGLGPLVAGFLAEWVAHPLTLPYLVFAGLGAIGLIGLAVTPETSTPTPTVAPPPKGQGSRPTGILIPGAAAILAAFAANGLFAGLSGLFLATTLHHPSHALSGGTLCLVFGSGVAAQLVTIKLPAVRILAVGTGSMIAGLAAVVVAVRLSTPSLALFLTGGALIGAGVGAVFKGTTGLVLGATPPERRLAATADMLIALYLGLSIPVIGAGIALDSGASPPDTVLVFAIVVGLGVAGAGALLGRELRSTKQ